MAVSLVDYVNQAETPMRAGIVQVVEAESGADLTDGVGNPTATLIRQVLGCVAEFFFTQGGLPCDPRFRRYEKDPRFDKLLQRLKVERCH